jgi:PAS domain S-box-containing protein
MNPPAANLTRGIAIGWPLAWQLRREAVQPEPDENPGAWTELPPLLAVTLESARDGIVTVDCAGQVICYNSRFVALWGMPDHLLHQGTFAELMSFAAERTRWPEQFRRLERDLAWSEEALDIVPLRDGRIIKRQIQPLLIGGDHVIRVVSFRDITQRKTATVPTTPAVGGHKAQEQPLASNAMAIHELLREITDPAQSLSDNLRFLLDAFDTLQNVLEIYPELLGAAKAQAVPPELLARATAALAPEDLKFHLEQIPAALRDTTTGITKILDGVRAVDAQGRQADTHSGVLA